MEWWREGMGPSSGRGRRRAWILPIVESISDPGHSKRVPGLVREAGVYGLAVAPDSRVVDGEFLAGVSSDWSRIGNRAEKENGDEGDGPWPGIETAVGSAGSLLLELLQLDLQADRRGVGRWRLEGGERSHWPRIPKGELMLGCPNPSRAPVAGAGESAL